MDFANSPKSKAIRKLAVVEVELAHLKATQKRLSNMLVSEDAVVDECRQSTICYQEALYCKQAAEGALTRCDWEQVVELAQASCEKAVNVLVPLARLAVAAAKAQDAAGDAEKFEAELMKILKSFTELLGADKTKLS